MFSFCFKNLTNICKFGRILTRVLGENYMNKGKLIKFIISIPFILALAFFIMFLRYYLNISGSSEITTIMNLYLIRYRNLAIFCLIFGFILLIIKSVFDYKNTNIHVENTNTHVLSTISSRNVVENKTYSLNDNRVVNDILNGEILEVKFLDSKIKNRKMKFINYSKENKSISLLDLEKEKGVLNYDRRYFTECSKCGSIISKDAPKCLYCNEVKKEVKKTRFNPVIFAVNMIIILLSIIVMVLLINKIKLQRDININNINGNIKTVETK